MRAVVVAWFVATGCFSPTPAAGLPCSASGQCPAGQMCSAQLTCERGAVDAPLLDAAPDTAVEIDAAIDACTSCPRLIAHYRFDGSLDDATDSHGATMVGGSPTYITGVTGSALRLPATATRHVRIEDAAAFDLPSGRIELQFRFGGDAPVGDLGLFSRDANDTVQGGHFGIRLSHDRRVVVRIQRQSNPSVSAYRCTAAPVAGGVWHHVDVRFGPGGLVLLVDGVVTTGTSWVVDPLLPTATVPCTDAWALGIDGNDNPIAIGALTMHSAEGTGVPATSISGDLDLDDVKIWSQP